MYGPKTKDQHNIEGMGTDFMCVPQVGRDPFRDKGMSFAQDLKGYIDWVLTKGESENDIDPMDPFIIY